jgi:nitrite reductase (cytochrome c-552)
MSDPQPADSPGSGEPRRTASSRTSGIGIILGTIIFTALVTAGIAALLVTIFQHKQEAKNPYIRFVEVNELTSDPEQWGKNWPREFHQYQRTADITYTRYGGSDGITDSRLEKDPWLKRMFAGYAFSIDFRQRRGHAYMLSDQEKTERVLKKPQMGSCLNCHSSLIPTLRRIGLESRGKTLADVDLNDFDLPDVMSGFDKFCRMTYTEAHAQLLMTPDGTSPNVPAAEAASPRPTTAPTTQQALAMQKGEAHPVSCIDCHDPRTMDLRVTRPAFLVGIKALKKSQGIDNYDPNINATRQEMRSFVCGQCHVEYYCGNKTPLFFPWGNGLKVEQIESYYDNYKFPDGHTFYDWKHAETGAELLKAQHPEFELWNQGVHARSGVACADCHMPYVRQGAMKVSDHHVRSPLLTINNSCQTCHRFPEDELRGRVETIQNRNHDLMQRAAKALVDMLDAINLAKANGVNEQQLAPALALQRKAQWRLDFVNAENSMGFHAPQECARILGEAADYARQGQVVALTMRQQPVTTQPPAPADQVLGVTPHQEAPINTPPADQPPK